MKKSIIIHKIDLPICHICKGPAEVHIYYRDLDKPGIGPKGDQTKNWPIAKTSACMEHVTEATAELMKFVKEM